jgi:DNA-binding transcriptional regulator LsrR (DeoR family)
VVALRPDRLAGTVIGVAGGAAKASAILAALRGDYLDVLVTDRFAAESVLGLHQQSASDLVEV